MNTDQILALVFARNAFYRRMHFLALSAFLMTLVVIGTLICVMYFLLNNPTPPLYFATDKVGRLIQIIPVDQPNMSDDEVAAWAIYALQKTYSYDYVNYRGQLQSAQKYFTNYGWSRYMEAMSGSNNLAALTQRKQIAIAQVIGSPTLVTKGILGGAYAWKFNMSMLMTYWEPPYDDKSKSFNPLDVSIIVQRQPILQSDKGLGIVQIVAQFTASAQPTEISSTPTG